jgi:protein phosphatase
MKDIVIPDPSMVVLIGPAGVGKSTFAARHAAPAEILSSDAFRLAIAGDAADQRASGLAFRRLHDELAHRLAARRLTVVDATNLTPHARRVLLGRARDVAIAAVAIVFDMPATIVQSRNAGRVGRVVPPDVVETHLLRLRTLLDSGEPARALEAEGFDHVFVLSDPVAMDGVRLVRRPA